MKIVCGVGLLVVPCKLKAREAQISDCLKDGIARIPDMVRRMYTDVDPVLYGAAARSVLAHLIHMVQTGRAACAGHANLRSSTNTPNTAKYSAVRL